MMPTNLVLNVSRQLEWLCAFRRAHRELGWVPQYWITYEQNHDQVGEAFPAAIRHPRLDLNRGIVPEEFRALQSGSLSSDLIERSQPYVLSALEILDRFDLDHSMSHSEKTRLIYRLLSYWLGTIEVFSLDMGIFSATPHGLGNYLLYAALKLAGKQIRIFFSTAVESITFVGDDIDALPPQLVDTYRSIRSGNQPLVLSDRVRRAVQSVREAAPDFRPWYVHKASSREEKRQSFIDGIEKRITDLSVTKRFLPDQPISLPDGLPYRKRRGEKGEMEVARAFKVPGRPIGDKMISLQEYEDYRDWAMVQKFSMREQYNSLCSQPDFQRPFIYFGLHYQPEKTTCPDGGYFSDQYLCAALLSKGILEDWEIVIKEHPNQFRYTGMGETARWDGYYSDFLKLGNVRFVSTETSSIDLIDKSQAVATVTGAVGWEALVRRKPALVFGAAWYAACVGAYQIKRTEDVANACQDILTGRSPTDDDVFAYAAALEQIGKPVFTTPTAEGSIKVDGEMGDLFFNLLRGDSNAVIKP